MEGREFPFLLVIKRGVKRAARPYPLYNLHNTQTKLPALSTSFMLTQKMINTSAAISDVNGFTNAVMIGISMNGL